MRTARLIHFPVPPRRPRPPSSTRRMTPSCTRTPITAVTLATAAANADRHDAFLSCTLGSATGRRRLPSSPPPPTTLGCFSFFPIAKAEEGASFHSRASSHSDQSHSGFSDSTSNDKKTKMGRKFFVGGNWKMNGTKESIDKIVDFLKAGPLDPNCGELLYVLPLCAVVRWLSLNNYF